MNKIWKSHFKINIKSIVLFIASKDISVRFDQTSLQICLCLIFPLDLIQEVMVLKLNQTSPETFRVWRELSPTKQDSKTLVESKVIQAGLVYKSWHRDCMEKKRFSFCVPLTQATPVKTLVNLKSQDEQTLNVFHFPNLFNVSHLSSFPSSRRACFLFTALHFQC